MRKIFHRLQQNKVPEIRALWDDAFIFRALPHIFRAKSIQPPSKNGSYAYGDTRLNKTSQWRNQWGRWGKLPPGRSSRGAQNCLPPKYFTTDDHRTDRDIVCWMSRKLPSATNFRHFIIIYLVAWHSW